MILTTKKLSKTKDLKSIIRSKRSKQFAVRGMRKLEKRHGGLDFLVNNLLEKGRARAPVCWLVSLLPSLLLPLLPPPILEAVEAVFIPRPRDFFLLLLLPSLP